MHVTEKHRCHPYSPTIHIVVCDDINVARRELNLKLYDKSNWGKEVAALFYENHPKGENKMIPYIFLCPKQTENIAQFLGFLAHECDHAVNSILNYSGVKIEYNNDEAHTYLLQWIVEKCFTLYCANSENYKTKTEIIKIISE